MWRLRTLDLQLPILGSVFCVLFITAFNASAASITLTDSLCVDGIYRINSGESATITINDNVTCAIENYGTLTISGSGTLTSGLASKSAINNYEGATATINGGTYRDAKQYWAIMNQGTMTINDGNFYDDEDASTTNAMIQNGWDGTITGKPNAVMTINGGDFNSNGWYSLKNSNFGEVVINDGTFQHSGANYDILNWNLMTINGGTFNAEANYQKGGVFYNTSERANDSSQQGKLIITGGTFTNLKGNIGNQDRANDAMPSTDITGGDFYYRSAATYAFLIARTYIAGTGNVYHGTIQICGGTYTSSSQIVNMTPITDFIASGCTRYETTGSQKGAIGPLPTIDGDKVSDTEYDIEITLDDTIALADIINPGIANLRYTPTILENTDPVMQDDNTEIISLEGDNLTGLALGKAKIQIAFRNNLSTVLTINITVKEAPAPVPDNPPTNTDNLVQLITINILAAMGIGLVLLQKRR